MSHDVPWGLQVTFELRTVTRAVAPLRELRRPEASLFGLASSSRLRCDCCFLIIFKFKFNLKYSSSSLRVVPFTTGQQKSFGLRVCPKLQNVQEVLPLHRDGKCVSQSEPCSMLRHHYLVTCRRRARTLNKIKKMIENNNNKQWRWLENSRIMN